MQGICLAVTTGPYVPQVLSIKADDKISNVLTAEVQVSNAGVLEQATAFPFYRCIVLLRNNNMSALSK